jgi:hypothetical protein
MNRAESLQDFMHVVQGYLQPRTAAIVDYPSGTSTTTIWLRSYSGLSQHVQIFTCQAHPVCKTSYNIDQLSPRRRPRRRSLIRSIDIRRHRSLQFSHALHIDNHRIYEPKRRAVFASLAVLASHSLQKPCQHRIPLMMKAWNAGRLSTPPSPHTRSGNPSLRYTPAA